jgi:hypothetical protein
MCFLEAEPVLLHRETIGASALAEQLFTAALNELHEQGAGNHWGAGCRRGARTLDQVRVESSILIR